MIFLYAYIFIGVCMLYLMNNKINITNYVEKELEEEDDIDDFVTIAGPQAGKRIVFIFSAIVMIAIVLIWPMPFLVGIYYFITRR